MLSKKLGSMKKLAKLVRSNSNVVDPEQSQLECLIRERETIQETSNKTPMGSFAVYVGEEKQRFVVPTGYLSHPLFKMLLEKSHNEFGFDHRNGLVVPCSVIAFQEMVSAIECCNRKFDFGDLVEEFI